MKIGIFPFFIILAALVNLVGGVAIDLCIAGAAVAIAVSMWVLTRNKNAAYLAVTPLFVVSVRLITEVLYAATPGASTEVPAVVQWLAGPGGLILASLASIVASYLIGVVWVFNGTRSEEN